MNEAQYRSLCAACDRFLLAPEAGVERIAIPWLHVIRAHPIFLDGYGEVFNPGRTEGATPLRNLASAIRHLGKAVAADGRPWAGEIPQKTDVLIVSHLVNESFAGQEDDFYYGNAAAELAAQGISSIIALINYTDLPAATLAAQWNEAKTPRVVFSPVLDPATERSLYRRTRAEARRLRIAAQASASDFDRRVATRAAREAEGGGAVSALRLGEQIRALVEKLQPRAIVVTYEGHSWERVAFAGARAAAPGITCIGYQHAALFNMQHAIQRNLADGFNPDAILTSGQMSRLRLQNNPELSGVYIAAMGSNRSFARQPKKRRPTDKHACIVLPEGLDSECKLLFGFSLACAQAMPEIEFIWRLHPNMSYEMLAKQNPSFRELPSNIILSKQPLADDIARSHWGLYRGSTAIVQAAVSGVWPIYLSSPDEISIDTLYEIETLRAGVAEVADFRALVVADAVDPEAADRLQDYCEQMFTPLDVRVLAACVAARTDR